MSYSIRPARCTDAPAVIALILEATRWIATLGSDQWQYPDAVHTQAVRQAIDRGIVWSVTDGNRVVVATISLDERADPEFWTPVDEPASALYAHRMAVARSAAGQEIGAAMLDWASTRAAEAGKRWIRLDAWARNTDLHRYYERHGFALVRLLRYDHRGSGALYQRPAGSLERLGPALSCGPSVDHDSSHERGISTW